jgi:hypothetical protein
MKLLIFVVVLSSSFCLNAEPEPIIYGTVTTENGDNFTGSIIWGKQESFLSDIFNAQKTKTTGIEHLSQQQLEELEDHQPGPQVNFGDIQVTFKSFFGKDIEPPEFSVHFGAIKHIDIKANDFIVTLHDGTLLISHGHADDLRATIHLKDSEGQAHSFELDELKRVTFQAAPVDALTWGDGIYGRLTTTSGVYSGRIMWDKDERLSHEKLDGSQNQKEYAIQFSDIASIEKNNDSSVVVLRNGKSLTLSGTNDVNSSNRGIRLDHPRLGRLEFSWDQFQKLVIEPVDVPWLSVDDYQAITKHLSGIVLLKNGQKHKFDQMAFDLNHQSNAELIHFKTKKLSQQLPLRLVKKITVIDSMSARLTLRNGDSPQAYGSHAVNHDNNGLLITQKGKHQWLKWQDIQAIEFD